MRDSHSSEHQWIAQAPEQLGGPGEQVLAKALPTVAHTHYDIGPRVEGGHESSN